MLLPIIVRNSSTLQLLVFTGKKHQTDSPGEKCYYPFPFSLSFSLLFSKSRFAFYYLVPGNIILQIGFFFSPPGLITPMGKNFFFPSYIIPFHYPLRMNFARIVWNRHWNADKMHRIRVYGLLASSFNVSSCRGTILAIPTIRSKQRCQLSDSWILVNR